MHAAPDVLPDVLVVGGGVIGLATAWRAAEAGMAVTLVDDAAGRGASWAAAGQLAPVTEVTAGEERLLELTLAASRAYPDFVAELEQASGLATGYQRCGTLVVARDQDENAALGAFFDLQQRLGLAVERLTSRQTRRLEPALSPRVRGGVLVEGDHQIDNRALLDALAAAGRHAGVSSHAGRVAGIRCVDGRAVGVTLADGELLDAGAVVLAAGCWTPHITGLPARIAAAIRPVKGQLLQLRRRSGRGEAELATRNLRGPGVYLVPRADGRVVVGATVEEQGFDTAVTAGGVHQLLRDACELVPAVAELELTETVAGLRPASPDNAPLIGETEVEGLLVDVGHYRNGVLLAPVTADALAEHLATGITPERVAGFSPQRFAAHGAPGRGGPE
jgi:glycine oxidase